MAPLPRSLRLLTHLAVSFGFMALWLPPVSVPPLFITLALLLLWPALALPQPVPWRAWRVIWDVITVAVLTPAVAVWFAVPPQAMTALVVALVVIELRWAHNPGGPRQVRLMVAVAILLLALVGRSTESPLFLAAAAPLFVFGLGAFAGSEALHTFSLATAPRHLAPPRVLEGRSVLLTPIRLAATAGALGGAIFLLFPRVGRTTATEALAGEGAQDALTGMTSQVILGDYGRLLEDPSPAVHVTWESGQSAGPVYLRGAAFSLLERLGGSEWRWCPLPSQSDVICAAGEVASLVGGPVPPDATVQRVELLRPNLRTIYAAPWLVAVRGPGGTLDRIAGEHWKAPDPETRWPVYEAHSVPGGWPVSMTSPEEVQASLTVPEELRSAAAAILVHESIGATDPPEQRAQAIIHHLRDNHRHSLDLRQIRGPDRLLDFLRNRRAGNCEYFASAMVVLCRAAGLPARLATGFHGGEAQPDGSRLFRCSDAHAWAEVWIEGRGWTLLDPTPAAPLVADSDRLLWQGVSGIAGQVVGGWRSWVVDYEGAWHRRFLRWSGDRADRFLAAVSGETGLFQHLVVKMKRNLHEEPMLWIFIAGVLALNLAALWLDRRIRRRGWPWHRRRRPIVSPHEALVRQLAQALGRHPRQRLAGETAAEYLEAVGANAALPREVIREIAGFYYAWRFSPEPSHLSPRDLLAMAHRARHSGLSGA